MGTIEVRNIKGVVSDGGNVHIVTVESSYMSGFAGLQVLGNLGETCRSGKERARAALERNGIKLSPQRLVMGFSPADIKIEGAQLDLAMAMGLAAADGNFETRRNFAPAVFAAEVGLGGELRAVQGIVAFALAAAWAGESVMVVSKENFVDLAGVDVSPLKILGGKDVGAVLAWLGGDQSALEPMPQSPPDAANEHQSNCDFAEMVLTAELAKVAVAVAAGGHNLLMRGTPGSGKTMFAQRLAGIMPPPEGQKRLHCMQIHSLAGSSLAGLRHGAVAFRSPHHSASMAAVLGSGRMPGEISLAHEGVLFLDELPEFRRDLLEALREPLESGEVHIARAGGRVVWPARAVLVAACNNCPCGWSGSRFRMCRCQSNKPAVYRARLSGPLLDRIDIHVNMPESAAGRFSCVPKPGQAAGSTGPAVVVSSADLRSRVIGAREFATLRSRRLGITSEVANARLDPGSVHLACGWPDGGVVVRQLMEQADSDRSSVHIPEVVRSISSRGLGRALRVARTLADVDRAEAVGYEHFRQALMWQGEAAARMRGEHLESAGSWRSKSG